jgi:hypothetical protein
MEFNPRFGLLVLTDLLASFVVFSGRGFDGGCKAFFTFLHTPHARNVVTAYGYTASKKKI